jgi:cysteine synthase B
MANIPDLIGNTPMVELSSLFPVGKTTLLGKLEGHNPGGSVKDRAAYNMIKAALDRGDIRRGDKLVEATSGNTGIALAMIANVFGLEMHLVMPEGATRERIETMKAFGAKVILTPREKTIEYSRQVAEEMAASGYVMLNQFANEDNWKAHYLSTGPEIWRDTEGKVTHFIASMGTTGTIMGVSKYLKTQNPNIQIIGVQPVEGSNIPGIRRWSPEYLPAIYQPEWVDTIVDVSQDEAIHTMKRLAREAAVFAGVSSGGAVTAAGRIMQNITQPAVMVAIICDRGDRYLSEGLFS